MIFCSQLWISKRSSCTLHARHTSRLHLRTTVSPSHPTLRTGYDMPRMEGLSHPPPRAEAGPRFPVTVTETAVNARLTRAHASSYLPQLLPVSRCASTKGRNEVVLLGTVHTTKDSPPIPAHHVPPRSCAATLGRNYTPRTPALSTRNWNWNWNWNWNEFWSPYLPRIRCLLQK